MRRNRVNTIIMFTHGFFNDLDGILKEVYSILWTDRFLQILEKFRVPVNEKEPYKSYAIIGADDSLVPSGKMHYLGQCWPISMSPYGMSTHQSASLL